MHDFPPSRSRALALACVVALAAASFSMTARPQGVTATAKPAVSSTPSDVAMMKRRIDELERRVLELEKQKAEQIEAEKQGDAADKKFEQRLASVESAQRNEQSERNEQPQNKAPAESSNTKMSGSPTFVAPFTVVDAAGKVLMRVDRSPKGNPRLTVGNPRGASAVLAASTIGGSMQLSDATHTVRLSAFGDFGGGVFPGVMVRTAQGYSFLGGNPDGLPVVQITNLASKSVVELRGLESQSGLLMISNEGGDALVMAGEATNGVGVVKTGPNGNGPGATLGNAGKAASEIVGRK